jgi:hypothetical protein
MRWIPYYISILNMGLVPVIRISGKYRKRICILFFGHKKRPVLIEYNLATNPLRNARMVRLYTVSSSFVN